MSESCVLTEKWPQDGGRTSISMTSDSQLTVMPSRLLKLFELIHVNAVLPHEVTDPTTANHRRL